MNRCIHYCTAAGLIALGLIASTAGLAQGSPTDTEPLPIVGLSNDRANTQPPAVASGKPLSIKPADNTPPARAQNNRPALAQRVAALRQQIEQLTSRFDKRAHRIDQRLAEQAQRIKALEQTVRRLQDRRCQPTTPTTKSIATDRIDSGRHRATKADDGKDAPEAADDEAGDGDTEATGADTPGSHRDSDPADCTGTHADHFQFDVFFQASTDSELAAAADKVQAIGLRDWFVLPDLKRLYVGRYGTCTRAERRQTDIHQRTGLALTIDAVEPDSNTADAVGDTAGGAGATQRDTVAAERTMPFRIVSVERRGRHMYLGVARGVPFQLGDIAWLQPGQALGAWRLESIHTRAGTATFIVRGEAVTVALAE